MTIPATFHRIWVGDARIPKQANDYWEKFRALHPDWNFVTWSDPIRAEDFELGRLFSSCKHPAQLADLMRIEIVHRHGGIYVDIDVEPIRSFDPLRDYDFFVVGCELFGGTPSHAATRALMDQLLSYGDSLPEGSINEVTGPLLWREVVTDDIPGVIHLPFELFSPWRFDETPDRGRITEETFSVNHWFGTWVAKPPFRSRLIAQTRLIARRVKRLLRSRRGTDNPRVP